MSRLGRQVLMGAVAVTLVVTAGVILSCSGPSNQPPTVNAGGGGAGCISGYARDQAGAPLAGVLVAVSDGQTIYSTTTGSDGSYEICDVPVGARVVSFDKDGYLTTHEATVVSSSGTVQVDGVLRSGDSCSASLPVIHIDSADVDAEICVVEVTGSIDNVLADTAVAVINGSESIIALDDGHFDTLVVLCAAQNEIVIRSSNCRGNVLSEPIPAECTAEFVFRVTLTWDKGYPQTDYVDIDLHTWGPGLDGQIQHSSFVTETIDAGELDFDDTYGFGPENFTARTVIPGRYAIGVNYFLASDVPTPPVGCTIRVTVPGSCGTAFGPHTLTAYNRDEGYPITVDTTSWWRPVDIIVASNGTASIVAPDTSISYPEYGTEALKALTKALTPGKK
jgi:uncharacterized protein YfaP (DUF2135 family)